MFLIKSTELKINTKYKNYNNNNMLTTAARPNERTVLLRGNSIDSGRDCDHDHDRDDALTSTFAKTRIHKCKSFSQIKKVIHNNLKNTEDIDTLLGSTSVVRNSIVEQMTAAEAVISNNTTSSSSNNTNANINLLRTEEGRHEHEDTNSPTSSGIYSKYYHDNISLDNSDNDDTLFSHVDDRDTDTIVGRMSILFDQKIQKPTNMYLKKINTNLFEDTKLLAEGSIRQSIVLAIVIGIVCGVACYLYYSILFFALTLFWTTIPQTYIIPSGYWSSDYYWLWIPLVTMTMVSFVGLTVVYMGEPGDLPYVISRVHSDAYIPMNHVSPMVFASMFSIVGKYIYVCVLALVYS